IPVLGHGLPVKPQAQSCSFLGQSLIAALSYIHNCPHFLQVCSPLESVDWLQLPTQFEWVSFFLPPLGHFVGIFRGHLGVRTFFWTYKSGGSPCIPTRNE